MLSSKIIWGGHGEWILRSERNTDSVAIIIKLLGHF